MARTVKEWIAKHDDATIPTDVQLRVWNRAGGCCQSCTRKIMTGEPKHIDHIAPLADGGEHRERNLQLLCVACHRPKTAAENSERARVKRKAKAVHGFVVDAPKMQGRPFPKTTKSARREKAATSKLPLPGPKPLYAKEAAE